MFMGQVFGIGNRAVVARIPYPGASDDALGAGLVNYVSAPAQALLPVWVTGAYRTRQLGHHNQLRWERQGL